MAGALPVEQALDNARLTPFHWRVWLLSAMGVFLDGFDLFILGVALPLIGQQFGPGPVLLGLIGAAAPLGAVLGASVIGWLSDRFGRKLVYSLDLVFFALFALLGALAWGPLALLVFRFLLGIAVGADYPISSSYLSEFMPARLRGRMLAGAFSFQAFGSLSGAALGLVILLL